MNFDQDAEYMWQMTSLVGFLIVAGCILRNDRQIFVYSITLHSDRGRGRIHDVLCRYTSVTNLHYMLICSCVLVSKQLIYYFKKDNER
jgi:hypothetical protein